MPIPSGAVIDINPASLDGSYSDGATIGSFTDDASVSINSGTYPILKKNIVNTSVSVIRFNGSSQYLKTVSNLDLSATNKVSVFIVLKLASNFSSLRMMLEHSGNASANEAFALYNSAARNFECFLGTAGSDFQTSEDFDSFKLLHVDFDRSVASSEVLVRVDATSSGGTRLADNNNTGNFASNVLYIGCRGAGTGFFVDFDLCRLVIYDRLLNSTERGQVEAEFDSLYNLAYTPSGGDRTLTADSGSFTLTGQSANLLYNRNLTAGVGSFALTGQSANLIYNRALSAETGEFVLTGQDAVLGSKILVADSGTFALTGQDANLLKQYALTAGTGSFALAGQDAALLKASILSGNVGAFVLSGQTVNFVRQYVLTAQAGSFVLTGQDVVLDVPIKLFPPDLMSKLTQTPKYLTTITTGKSGRESRNAEWSEALRSYDAAQAISSKTSAFELIKFFHTCRGRHVKFYIKDYLEYSYDYTATLLTGNASRTAFQMRYVYEDDFGDTVPRTITKPKRNTVGVKVNGVLKTEGTDYTANYATGVITFASAPANNAVITQKCEFYVPVRFASDELPTDLMIWYLDGNSDEQTLAGLSPIPIQEVRV